MLTFLLIYLQLKSKLARKLSLGPRQGLTTPSVLQLPPPQHTQTSQPASLPNVNSTVIKSEPSSSSQVTFSLLYCFRSYKKTGSPKL